MRKFMDKIKTSFRRGSPFKMCSSRNSYGFSSLMLLMGTITRELLDWRTNSRELLERSTNSRELLERISGRELLLNGVLELLEAGSLHMFAIFSGRDLIISTWKS